MKTLIVYYSYTANNEKLAQKLQRLLNCDILKIEELKRRTGFTIFLDVMFSRTPAIKVSPCSLNAYGHIIFVAPVWAGKIATPLKAFLLNEKTNVSRYSLITLCGGVQGQADKLWKELTSHVSKEPQKLTELWINDLLPQEKRDTVKYTSGYRVAEEDFKIFETKIQDFLKQE